MLFLLLLFCGLISGVELDGCDFNYNVVLYKYCIDYPTCLYGYDILMNNNNVSMVCFIVESNCELDYFTSDGSYKSYGINKNNTVLTKTIVYSDSFSVAFNAQCDNLATVPNMTQFCMTNSW